MSDTDHAQGAHVSDLTKLAAECHRAKWQFDLSEDFRPSRAYARALILKGFAELHRIGDVALKMRDEAKAGIAGEVETAADRAAIIEECARAAEKAWPFAHTYASENAGLYRGQDHAVQTVVKAIRGLAMVKGE